MRSADDEFSDPAAERAVLSAILLDERQSRGTYALAATVIRVQAERRDDGLAVDGDFADPRHNLIFAAMGELSRRGEEDHFLHRTVSRLAGLRDAPVFVMAEEGGTEYAAANDAYPAERAGNA